MLRQNRLLVLSAAVVFALLTGLVPVSGDDKPVVIKGARSPGGILGDELGEYLTIEGVADGEGKKGGNRVLRVDTVGGKKLAKPVNIRIHNYDVPEKQRCIFKGYETGEMIGTPPAVTAARKELGRSNIGESQAMWQWHTHFVVLIVVEPVVPKK